MSVRTVSIFIFFKKTTAYEIRPRDWSSDVCSSDLGARIDGEVRPDVSVEAVRLHLEARVARQHQANVSGVGHELIAAAAHEIARVFDAAVHGTHLQALGLHVLGVHVARNGAELNRAPLEAAHGDVA